MAESSTSQRSRVAVIGGGLVGATTALLLHGLGFPVTLVDRQRPKINTGALGIDIRNVALSPASRSLLQQAGIWGEVPATPYHHMCVWEQWGTAEVHFDAADAGVPELGWLIEMSPLVCAAWQQLEVVGVELVEASIQHVVPQTDNVLLQFDNGAQQFDFVIAADGAQSVVRKALNLGVEQQHLDQVAIATVVRTAEAHQQTAWQRFLVEGPLAFLPAPDPQVCSVVWSQTKAKAEQRLQLDDAAFAEDIGHAIEHRLGEVLAVDQRFSFPLTQQRVKQCAPHPRVLLIGDAMRVVHPLAGQGVNLGLEDVHNVLQVAAHQSNLAAPDIWQRFARQRQTRSALMIQVMATLQQVYTNPKPAMALLRNLGVQTFNALDGVKRQVMREAMGLSHLG